MLLRGMNARSNGSILSKIPEAMRAIKHEFLENSDEFGSWFFETYQRTEEKDCMPFTITENGGAWYRFISARVTSAKFALAQIATSARKNKQFISYWMWYII